jgi:hypothetical protein
MWSIAELDTEGVPEWGTDTKPRNQLSNVKRLIKCAYDFFHTSNWFQGKRST